MISTSLTTPARLQKNVLRQAKRFSKTLDIPLTHAKTILAQTAYICASWEDLMARLTELDKQDRALLLAQLPHSAEAQAYLARNLRDIARSVARSVLTNQNLAGMFKVLRYVFEESDKEVELSDIVDSLSALSWRTTNTAPDPLAVIESFVKVNGVPFKLIGTRTYLPQYLDLGDELGATARFAAHFGTPLEIIWSEPKAWHTAAHAYLSASDEDFDDAELVLPKADLDSSMRTHEAWFRKVLRVWQQGTEYGDEDESDFIPLSTPAGTYIVFGFPSSDHDGASAPDQVCQVQLADSDNDINLVLIKGLPFCIERLSESQKTGTHTGPFGEYYASVVDSLLDHTDCDLRVCSQNGARTGVCFIRPASQRDIRSNLKLEVSAAPGQEAWTIKTDNIQIADEVLERVVNRDLTSFKSRSGPARYVVNLDVTRYEKCHGFSLALEIVGETTLDWSSLVLGTLVYTRDDGGRTIIMELSERILGLVEIIGKRALLDAAKHGLVLQRPQGLHDALDKAPRWCFSLAAPSQAIIDMFENRLKSVEPMSLFDLWRHTKLVKYRKNNY